MNPLTEGREKISSVPEELSRLQEAALKHKERAEKGGVEIGQFESAREAVNQYSAIPHSETLHPSFAVSEKEVKKIAVDLAPEEHDQKIEQLVSLMQDKGIKNAIRVVEKMEDPHLLDDFHRFLVQFLASGYQISDLKEGSELWKPLHMMLFEVSLPDVSESEREKSLKELISGMEQFYSGMLSVSTDRKSPGWFSIEIANSNGSEEFIFYVSVPTISKALFVKQILAIFPSAHVEEHKDDYNIFNEKGTAAASYLSLSKHFLYPLKVYEEFNVDPLSSILNAFSKINRDGEGAAVQLIIKGREDMLAKESAKALEEIRKGAKVSEALEEIGRSASFAVAKEIFGIFKTGKDSEKEKESKGKRIEGLDQTTVEQFTRKLKSPFVSINLRAVASAETESEAKSILQDIESSFNQFENGHGNRIEWKNVKGSDLKNLLERFSLRTWNDKEKAVLNLEEVTSIIHFPATQVGKAAPQLKQAKAGTAPLPLEASKEGNLIGMNNHRGEETKVFISPEDRMRHFYAIGQTGTGKTTLLRNMIIQDIRAGHGVCFIDPHGSDVQEILANIPEERRNDVIYFDPAMTDRPMGLNMLEFDHRFPEQKTFVVNEMFNIFQKLYGAVPESMGPMFEQYFRNATMLVIEDPDSGSTLLDVSRVMSNKAFRDLKVSKCGNPVVVQFWKEVAEKAGGEAALANIVPYITSKFDVFLANEIMRPIVAQEKSSFNLREIMDGKKILLVNLSKGRLGDINSHLIGLILVGKILMAALSRVDSVGKEVPDFYLYLDEFQNITTDSIATILSEARKYRLSLSIAHQFIGQLDEKIKNAVFGNVGSMAVFRVGTEDAEFLEKQFTPVFSQTDIVNLDNFNAYVRLLANGRPIKPFSMRIMPPEKGELARAEMLKAESSQKFGHPRAEVEAVIMAKYQAPGQV
ncbi:MAG: TraM recognition domain-containing protein [Patescibacteria group bacterium]